MDHQTFAQLLGNYGEFFGAIAVVATLGYLAVQIRQNTRSLDEDRRHSIAQAAQQRTDLGVRLLLAGAESTFADALRRGRESDDLAPEFAGSARSYYGAYMRHVENLYYQFLEGFLDEYHSEQLPHMATFLFFKGGYFEEYWQAVTANAEAGRGVFNRDFVEYVNESRGLRDSSLGVESRF